MQRTLSLEERTGLPDDLRFLVAQYPRETWQNHANLGGMAQFWLRRHGMFRDLGALLNRGILRFREGELDRAEFTGWFVPRLNFFLGQLSGHHQIEDHHYFPVFRRAERRLARGFDILDRDHHILHDALDSNASAMRELLRLLHDSPQSGQSAADAYADNTYSLVAMMMRHLEDEEDLIVPVILDQGERELGIG